MYHDAIRRVARPCSTKVDVYPPRRRPVRRMMRSIARHCDIQNTNLKFESVETKPSCLYNPGRTTTARLSTFSRATRSFSCAIIAKAPRRDRTPYLELKWPVYQEFFWYVQFFCTTLFAHTKCLVQWYSGTVPGLYQAAQA